jgi:hypothetical protein
MDICLCSGSWIQCELFPYHPRTILHSFHCGTADVIDLNCPTARSPFQSFSLRLSSAMSSSRTHLLALQDSQAEFASR